MRQYYDVYSLLNHPPVIEFIGSEEYHQHKKRRFPRADFDIPIRENEAFLLNNNEIRNRLQGRYDQSRALYYNGQPTLEEILQRIHQYMGRL